MWSTRSKGKQTAALALTLLGVALLGWSLYPVNLAPQSSPDFIDAIFANRLVILAARLLLVATAAVLALGGAFISLSIGFRIRNGEWLRRAGPFEISVPDKAVGSEVRDMEERADLAREKIARLEVQLDTAEGLLRGLRRDTGKD